MPRWLMKPGGRIECLGDAAGQNRKGPNFLILFLLLRSFRVCGRILCVARLLDEIKLSFVQEPSHGNHSRNLLIF